MLLMTLGERLRRGIEEDILAGRLAPGDLLDERALCDRYEVSRTPVREALLQLSTLGLISMRPRQPARVALINVAELLGMTETMSVLEAEAARLAARRMSEAQRRQLQKIQDDADAVVAIRDSAAFNEVNWNLHQALFAGSQNAFLGEQATNLRLRLHPYRCFLLRLDDRIGKAHAEHRELVRAVVAGEADQAFELMKQHLSLNADQLTYLVSQMPKPQHDEAGDSEADRSAA
ncbi:MAG: GntR family transcriptional regulator [Burkholderiales bacterium]|nr:GntR family transcriptional regulator [Burkholderiales bacterium]